MTHGHGGTHNACSRPLVEGIPLPDVLIGLDLSGWAGTDYGSTRGRAPS